MCNDVGVLSIVKLFSHIFGLSLVAVGFRAEEVGEKQPAQNQKKHHYLNGDDGPERAPHGHAAETIAIEAHDPRERAGQKACVVVCLHRV